MKPEAIKPVNIIDKELDRMYGLDWYDYTARRYDAVLGRFTTMDPLCEKYYWISPYAYCANNPIKYIDPTGMEIDRNSIDEWINATFRVSAMITILNGKNPNEENNERINSLMNTLNTMRKIWDSNQMYSLEQTNQKSGEIKYDLSKNKVIISYFDMDNFVHEITHAGQFEDGDIGFFINSDGTTIAIGDITDEIQAYSAQHAYSPIPGIKNPYEINSKWINSLKDNNGNIVYGPKGIANTSQDVMNSNTQFWQFRWHYILGKKTITVGEHPLDLVKIKNIKEFIFK